MKRKKWTSDETNQGRKFGFLFSGRSLGKGLNFGLTPFLFFSSLIVCLLPFSSKGQTLSSTPTVTDLSNVKITDEQWSNNIDHFMEIQLSDDEIQILSSRLNIEDPLKKDISKLSFLLREKSGAGYHEGRAQERAALNGKTPNAEKYESEYKEASQEILDLIPQIRSELGNKQTDFWVWLWEEHYISRSVWMAWRKNNLVDEETLVNEITEKIKNTPNFKEYQQKKESSFSNSNEQESYFNKHDLYIRKLIAYHFLGIKISGCRDKKLLKNYCQEQESAYNEILNI
jgi:hypothetical protein